MNQKNYKLSFLPIFYDDLEKIIDYITINLSNPDAAHRLVFDIEKAILKRLEMPEAYTKYELSNHTTTLHYRINVRNYSIFYVVIDNTMEVRRLIYSRRDFKELFEDHD